MKYSIGDKVEVIVKDKTYTGVVMPTPELAEKNILILKLDNGYNIGIKIKDAKIKKIGEIKLEGLPKYKTKINGFLGLLRLWNTHHPNKKSFGCGIG